VTGKAVSSPPPTLLAELAHELRTPLTAIIGFAEVMREQTYGPLGGRYAECAQAIHEAGRHLLGLVNDMTDVARIADGRWSRPTESFDIREPVNEAMRLFSPLAQARDVRLSAAPPREPVIVVASRQAISQILTNLLSNAFNATPCGGSVTIEVAAEGPDLRLQVIDSGATERADGAGEGLGLTLVRALCGVHGGRFDLALSDTGAVATARLPIVARR